MTILTLLHFGNIIEHIIVMDVCISIIFSPLNVITMVYIYSKMISLDIDYFLAVHAGKYVISQFFGSHSVRFEEDIF